MSQIFLVRHGERANMTPESPLSRTGKNQAKKLATLFKNLSLDVIYASDLRRARETAEAIRLYQKNVSYVIMPELQEIHASLVGGKIGQDEKRRKLDTKRADALFKRMFSKADNKRILIVAHGNLIKYLIAKCLDTPRADFWHRLHLDSASVTIVEIHKEGRTVHRIMKTYNSIEHLGKSYKTMFYTKKYDPIKE